MGDTNEDRACSSKTKDSDADWYHIHPLQSTTSNMTTSAAGNMGGNPYPLLGMDNILSWNVRGLHGPNKQKEVKLLSNEERVRLIGLLETTIKRNNIGSIAEKMFGG